MSTQAAEVRSLVWDMSPLLLVLAIIAMAGCVWFRTISTEKRSGNMDGVPPRPVCLIAWFLIIGGSLDLVHAVFLAFKGANAGSINWLAIPAGIALLGRSALWRKLVLCACILGFIAAPISVLAAICHWTIRYSFCGLRVNSHGAPALTILVSLIAFAFNIYAYRILTDPAVLAWFEPDARESRP